MKLLSVLSHVATGNTHSDFIHALCEDEDGPMEDDLRCESVNIIIISGVAAFVDLVVALLVLYFIKYRYKEFPPSHEDDGAWEPDANDANQEESDDVKENAPTQERAPKGETP